MKKDSSTKTRNMQGEWLTSGTGQPIDRKQYEDDLARKQKEHLERVRKRHDKKMPWRPCLHDSCPECHGTGIKENGERCVHMISCPCPKCSPMMMRACAILVFFFSFACLPSVYANTCVSESYRIFEYADSNGNLLPQRTGNTLSGGIRKSLQGESQPNTQNKAVTSAQNSLASRLNAGNEVRVNDACPPSQNLQQERGDSLCRTKDQSTHISATSASSGAASNVQPADAACPQSVASRTSLSIPKLSAGEAYASLIATATTSIEPPILEGNSLEERDLW